MYLSVSFVTLQTTFSDGDEFVEIESVIPSSVKQADKSFNLRIIFLMKGKLLCWRHHYYQNNVRFFSSR